MGKATKWLKAFFGIKSSTKIGSSGAEFRHHPPADTSPVEVAWLRSYYPQGKLDDGGETEWNKHTIAVAAATVAAAEAAVVAAHAAAEVVKLTSRRRNNLFTSDGVIWAAIRIQTNFRGYLARKALRALRGVVKIQALIRGYLVRKQALFRVQSKRAACGLIRGLGRPNNPARSKSFHCAHPYMGEFGDGVLETEEYYKAVAPWPAGRRRLSTSFEVGPPKVVEVDNGQPGSRSGRRRPVPNNLFSDPSSYHLGECGPTTAQSTPRFLNRYNHLNYMAKTTSFKGKARPQSAPKQRPEPTNGKTSSVSGRKRVSLSEMMMEARNSLSEVRIQRSYCSHVQEFINFNNAVMGN